MGTEIGTEVDFGERAQIEEDLVQMLVLLRKGTEKYRKRGRMSFEDFCLCYAISVQLISEAMKYLTYLTENPKSAISEICDACISNDRQSKIMNVLSKLMKGR